MDPCKYIVWLTTVISSSTDLIGRSHMIVPSMTSMQCHKFITIPLVKDLYVWMFQSAYKIFI